jgi:hypothetical protein
VNFVQADCDFGRIKPGFSKVGFRFGSKLMSYMKVVSSVIWLSHVKDQWKSTPVAYG